MQRRTYFFSGRVQGVGFRYTARHIAKTYPAVTGYVRNLSDGRVEMVMEGDDGEMDAVLETLKQHMRGNIERTNVSKTNATGEFTGFVIR